MAEVLHDDAGIINGMAVIGFENGDFADRREGNEAGIWSGWGDRLLFVDDFIAKSHLMGRDEAHAHKWGQHIAIESHRRFSPKCVDGT
jgi:hypothetical protein